MAGYYVLAHKIFSLMIVGLIQNISVWPINMQQIGHLTLCLIVHQIGPHSTETSLVLGPLSSCILFLVELYNLRTKLYWKNKAQLNWWSSFFMLNLIASSFALAVIADIGFVMVKLALSKCVDSSLSGPSVSWIYTDLAFRYRIRQFNSSSI